MTAGPTVDFDALLAGPDPAAEEGTERTVRRGRGMIVSSIALLAVGGLVISLSALLANLPQRPPRLVSAAPEGPSSGRGEVIAPAEEPVADAAPQHGTAISALVDEEWVTALAVRTGIPIRALSAYTGAAVALAEESPGCGLGWNTLAGIGFVESEHGTIHGSTISASGTAEPAIVGIALTGATTERVADTDGGALDGDAVWDRAVGPLQFLPSTWGTWGSDGNGDGVIDPQNIDDAALAAGRYLCYAGGDLTNASSWIAAVHAYNPTVEYNNLVADAASYYASR